MLSNYIGPYPLEKVESYSRKNQRKVQVSMPSLIKTMLWVVWTWLMRQLEHTGHRSRWWPHLTNTLRVLIGAAWNIYWVTNSDEDQSLLFFQSVVQSYFHLDAITTGPSFWKTKIQVASSNRLTDHFHWPTFREKQQRCTISGCSTRIFTYCEECDVALSINDYFKQFDTLK